MLLACLVAIPTHAEDCIHFDDYLHGIGSVDTPGKATDVEVVGSIAYLTDGAFGLHVVDVSNPAAPALLGNVITTSAIAVAVAGSHAYVADGESGLQVVDVSTPSVPAVVGNIDTPGNAVDVALSGPHAFVADTFSGVQIVDISNPQSPSIVGNIDTPGVANGVALVGSLLYVADGDSGLQIFDISNPTAPTLAGSVDTPGHAVTVAVSGGRAYINDSQAGFHVADVSNPSLPTIVGTLPGLVVSGRIAVAGNLAYVAAEVAGLLVLEVSNPGSMVTVGAIVTPGNALGVALAGQQAYVAASDAGLQVFDIANPRSPALLGAAPTTSARGVAVSGTHAYIADGASGLRVVDVSDPRAPTIAGSFATLGDAQDVAVAGSYAFVAAGSLGLRVVDVSDPSRPTLAGSLGTVGAARAIAIDGSYAYVVHDAGLLVADISDPRAPVEASQPPGGMGYGIAVSRGHAYITHDTGMLVLDVSNPRAPEFIANLRTATTAYDVAVREGLAYVAHGAGVQVIDVADPVMPAIVANVDLPAPASGIAVTASFAYVANQGPGLQVLDISDPVAPRIVTGIDTPGTAHDVTVAGSLAFIADDTGGLQIAPAPCHPAIAFSVQRLRLPVVTLGDAIESRFMIENAGTDTLIVTGTAIPAAGMQLDLVLPATLAPAATRQVTLTYAPLEVAHDSTTAFFTTNDPVSAHERLFLVWEARRIEPRSRLLTPSDTLALGQAVTVQVVTDPPVDVDSAAVRYRTAGADSFATAALVLVDSVPAQTWIGVVPGDAVAEDGLEHYVELRNGWHVATDPPAGRSAPFRTAVRPPVAITTTVRPTIGIQDLPVEVVVELPVGAIFDTGRLLYRRGGAAAPDSVPLMLLSPRFAAASIPGTTVGVRGLEYRVGVRTSTTTLAYPRRPGDAYETIRVSATRLEDTTHPGGRYRMLGLPLFFPPSSTLDLQDLLAGDPEFGAYDPLRWRAFRFDGTRNVEYSTAQSEDFRPAPGHSVWLVSRAAHRVDAVPPGGFSIDTSRPYAFALRSGWNQIANPFAFPVTWDAIRAELVRRGSPLAGETPVAFDPNRGVAGDYATDPPDRLAPYEGYFFFNTSAAAESLWVPAVEAPAAPKVATQDGWRIRVAARTRGAADGSNLLGASLLAENGRDALDQREPPPPPGPWVSLAFAAGLRCDVRAPDPDGHTWEIEVRSQTPAEEIALEFAPEGGLPDDLAVLLVDLETQESVALREPGGPLGAHRILSAGPGRPYRLQLLAGTSSYVARRGAALASVPPRTVLEPNVPNPFNATTRIRFGLAQPATVTLRIYDVRGALVATLLHAAPKPAGYHSVLWSGTRDDGRAAASGVYLCRLDAGGTQETRRIVLLE